MNPRARPGLTLIEILVVLAITGVLVGLLLPAVQRIREVARRAECVNNLRQVATAVLLYHDASDRLPMGEMPGDFSPHVAILPFLERRALFDAINFVVLDERGRGSGGRKPTWMDAITLTVGRSRVDAYVCPSELQTQRAGASWTDDRMGLWAANYAWNSGTWWPLARRWDGLFGRANDDTRRRSVPPDPPLGAIGLVACTDGLSHTLLVSEVANGSLDLRAARTRVSECYQVPRLAADTPMHEALASCDAVDWRSGALPWGGRWRFKGYPWVEGTLWRNWFNTVRTPNRTCCADGFRDLDAGINHWWFTLKPASSYHPGIVNAALADGSVRAFKETIDRATWMALSTRAGGEVLPPCGE